MLNRASVYGDQGFWIRLAYRELFKKQEIKAVVRLGDRSDPLHKNFIPAGVPLPVRFIKGFGKAEVGVPGNLLPDDGTTFIRTGCLVKCLGDLTEEDLAGSAPDTATKELVRYHLATINNTELPSWDTKVTIWRFEFVDTE
jgi:hypothetical protein